MRLVNAEEIQRVWKLFFLQGLFPQEPYPAGHRRLILIRHAHKIEGAGSRCGLSERGRAQAECYRQLAEPAMWNLIASNCFLCSSITRRNVETLEGLFGLIPPIVCSTGIDFADVGPNDEDYATSRELAKKLGIPPNEAFRVLEEHGYERKGERLNDAERRIRETLVRLLAVRDGRVVVYSGNSPTANQALGVPGVVPELGTLFFSHEDDRFSLVTRVDPVFED